MNKGTRIVLCVIATLLIMISERGIPVKLNKGDYLKYTIAFCILLYMTE